MRTASWQRSRSSVIRDWMTILAVVIRRQPLEDVVALADVGQRPRRVVRVGADEQVDASAPYLLPLAELVELGARRDQHLAGPVADLGEEDAGGLAVGEEDADGLAVHLAAPRKDARFVAVKAWE